MCDKVYWRVKAQATVLPDFIPQPLGEESEPLVKIKIIPRKPTTTNTVHLVGAKYIPYPVRKAWASNVCGHFNSTMDERSVEGALVKNQSSFGPLHELYHVDGSVNISQHRAYFKGCKGYEGLCRLSSALGLESPSSSVHMAILTSRIGKAIQVSCDGFLERRLLNKLGPKIKMLPRLEEEASARFEIKRFEGVLEIKSTISPLRNDWFVTSKGVVISRWSWKGLKWSQELEQELLDYHDLFSNIVSECC